MIRAIDYSEDNPGVGKTFLAKLFARVLGLSYRRIQFTPDLLPKILLQRAQNISSLCR